MAVKLVWLETATGKQWKLIDLDGGIYGQVDYVNQPDYYGFYADHRYHCYTVSEYGQVVGFDRPRKTLASAKNAVRRQVTRDAPWRVLGIA